MELDKLSIFVRLSFFYKTMTSPSKAKNNVTSYTFSIVIVRILMLKITRHDIIWQTLLKIAMTHL